MKHHSQRSKRPPSRTLAPRILAALAAGAFTLGGMPYALADPTVMSTVTTDTLANDGVAGSTDGTAATITVGTAGGGASPEVYYLAGSYHRPTFVAGAWRKVSATDGTIQFTGTNAGGKAIVNSGTIGGAIGAWAWLEHGGTAKISGAEVAIKNCTFKLDSTTPEPQWGIIGGLAMSKEGSGGGRGRAQQGHHRGRHLQRARGR